MKQPDPTVKKKLDPTVKKKLDPTPKKHPDPGPQPCSYGIYLDGASKTPCAHKKKLWQLTNWFYT